MEPHSPKSPRYSDTPPGSPKSCMKGARKLTFDKPEPASPSNPIPSPKRSPKVQIRMHDDGGGGDQAGSSRTSFDLPSTSSAGCQTEPSKAKAAAPPEIQFQFHLTEHFDQSTPPPNCTSNGNYDFEPEKEGQGGQAATADPQLVEIATKFVNEIIENAKVEAANRQKAEPRGSGSGAGTRDSFSNGIGRGALTWLRRTHGVVSKWITNICVRAQNIRADLK